MSGGIKIDFSFKIEWVRAIWKSGSQMACLPTKLNFLANGCVLGQNARKETPFKIQLYLTNNIALPKDTFSRAWQWHWFDLGLIYTFLLADWWFAARFSNCSSSLNFEAKSNFYTIKENCWKCRAKCTGLKLDLGPFSGSQKRLLFNRISWWPCMLWGKGHCSDVRELQRMSFILNVIELDSRDAK